MAVANEKRQAELLRMQEEKVADEREVAALEESIGEREKEVKFRQHQNQEREQERVR